MAARISRSDLFTGFFALLVIGSFVGVMMFLQVVGPTAKGDSYTIRFEDSGGISGGSPVIVAGQRVGRVGGSRTVPIAGSGGVEVEVDIIIEEPHNKAVRIPVDSVALVQMGTFFGGNQLVLRLGRSRDFVTPGQRLPLLGQPPTNFDAILTSAGETVKRLDAGVSRLAGVLNDERFIGNIEGSLESLHSALDRLDAGLRDLEPAFGRVGPAVTAAESLLSELQGLIADNRAQITGTLAGLERAAGRLDTLLADDGDGVPRLVAGLNAVAANLDVLIEGLNNVVLDNQLNIMISVENMREMTESLRWFARRIERDPSLLVWGSKEEDDPRAAPAATRGVDDLAIRNSGRRPRRESD
jgi:ABC-type transporter Mla subunit MlaD